MDLQYFFARNIDYSQLKDFQAALSIWSAYPNLDDLLYSEIKYTTDIDGLKLDFNFGLRMDIPVGDYHVTISDADSKTIFLDEDISGKRLVSFEKNYIRWHIEVRESGALIFEYTLNLNGKSVLIQCSERILGDTLAYLPFFRDFQKIHNANVKVILPNSLREFVANVYPELTQVDENNYDNYATFYATVMMTNKNVSTLNFNTTPINFHCANNLGFNHIVKPSKFKPTKPREIAEPYVCISVQASGVNKTWLYPDGWDIIVELLKGLGYRVLCIDRAPDFVQKDYTMQMPAQAENFTGNRPIMDRANMLYYAEFFIGLSSGLSWLAHAADCPVVMIGGFSQDWCEFYTPYRVANRLVCNGCYNSTNLAFLKTFCPKHIDTERELECSKKISPRMVKDAILDLVLKEKLTIPAFGKYIPRRQ